MTTPELIDRLILWVEKLPPEVIAAADRKARRAAAAAEQRKTDAA
jgi:hypothetical protein